MPHSEAVTSWVILAALRLSRIASPSEAGSSAFGPVCNDASAIMITKKSVGCYTLTHGKSKQQLKVYDSALFKVLVLVEIKSVEEFTF